MVRLQENSRPRGEAPRPATRGVLPESRGPSPPAGPDAPRRMPEIVEPDGDSASLASGASHEEARQTRQLGLAHLSPANPRRPLDWRWLRAGYLLDHGRRWSRRRDDGPTRRAKLFRAALRRSRGEADRRSLARRMPDVAGAYVIYRDEEATRWQVEARLLADTPGDAIARDCGVPAGAVDAYEQLFYNVKDRLRNRSYILFHAIGPAACRGFDAADTPDVLKLLAYRGGPLVLDFLLGVGGTSAGPGRPDAAGASPDEADRSARLRRMAIAAKTLPVDRAAGLRLIRLYQLQEELHRGPLPGAGGAISARLDAMLRDLDLSPVGTVPGCVEADVTDLDELLSVGSDCGTAADPVTAGILKLSRSAAPDHAEVGPADRPAAGYRRA
jgi:hypothetical protein